MKYIPLALVLGILLSGCSSESATTPQQDQNIPADSYGYLLDSAVAGLRYKSGGHFGVTTSDGRFGYLFGENIEFYIGNNLIAYATVPVERLTPYEFSKDSPFSTVEVLRLLQSLDDDGNPDNGILITDVVHRLAESVILEPMLSITFPPDWIDPDVIMQLTSVTTAGTRNAVSAIDAYLHFAGTLDGFIDELTTELQSLAGDSTCNSTAQCTSIKLEPQHTFDCPSEGPTIAYSSSDIDQAQFDALVSERAYLIDAKHAIENAAGANRRTTGVCIRFTTQATLVCNVSGYCEFEAL